MKIFITGNSGCGKSTVARKIAEKYNINLCGLDDIVWENGKKRSHEERKEILTQFLENENWVIEGMSHSEWMHDVYVKCDYFFLLDVSNCVAKTRVFKRFLRKKLGVEKGHKENLKYLKNLYKIRKEYEKEVIPEIKEKMKIYNNKSYTVKNLKQIEEIINKSKSN